VPLSFVSSTGDGTSRSGIDPKPKRVEAGDEGILLSIRSPFVISAGILFATTDILVFYSAEVSTLWEVDIGHDVGLVATSCLVALLFSIPSVAMLKNLTGKGARQAVASLCLSLSCVVPNILWLASRTYSFNAFRGFEYKEHGFPSGSLTEESSRFILISCLIIEAVLFMVLNIVTLRLSRGALEHILKNAKAQLKLMEVSVRESNAKLSTERGENGRLRMALDIINRCRPLSSSRSVIIKKIKKVQPPGSSTRHFSNKYVLCVCVCVCVCM